MVKEFELQKCADLLYDAETKATPIEGLSELGSGEEASRNAYGIQLLNVARQVRDGKRVVGYKIGLTSRDAQRQFKVFKPDYGHLLDSMFVADEGEIDLTTLIAPKIEGELAFVLGKDIRGPSVTFAEVLSAIDYAVVALEIVDCRIRDWKITWSDLVADNGAAARLVLSGTKRKIDGVDLAGLGMALSRNGEVTVTGAGAAVLGNPISAVVCLADELGKHDKYLCAGDVILSGALSSMVTVKPGDFYTCEIGKMGKSSVRFSNKLGDNHADGNRRKP